MLDTFSMASVPRSLPLCVQVVPMQVYRIVGLRQLSRQARPALLAGTRETYVLLIVSTLHP